MSTPIDEEALKEKYASFTDEEIRNEFAEIKAIPNARTNIEALTRLTVLMPEMDKRGIQYSSNRSSLGHSARQEESSFSGGTFLLGAALLIGGLVLSANSGRFFYGAMIVGVIMMGKSFIK